MSLCLYSATTKSYAPHVMCGLWSGYVIGLVTEMYTRYAYSPVQNLAEAWYRSRAKHHIRAIVCIIPIFCLAFTIFLSFAFGGMYGIALAALRMLGCLPRALTIDGYGPISNNAGGIAEMSRLDPEVRRATDKLDAAGNTTAAIGKGFAIGSACLVAHASLCINCYYNKCCR
jgi:H+-translocating diphosphatase